MCGHIYHKCTCKYFIMKCFVLWNIFSKIYVYVTKTVLRRFIAAKTRTSFLSNTSLKYFVIFMGKIFYSNENQ